MKNINDSNTVFSQFMACVQIAAATMVICCGVYTFFILGFGQLVTPQTADGSLVKDNQGNVIGSVLIAQKFSLPGYFWPRPSAADYNAAAGGGSNLSPAGSEIAMRAASIIDEMAGNHQNPVPAELVTASGSGLDPHISLEAAKYQAERVAKARGLEVDRVKSLLINQAKNIGSVLTPVLLVNVLEINLELDRMSKREHIQ